MSKALILIPTYNERTNIEDLIKKILFCSSDVEILVIDDNSPDGTADIVEKLSAKNPRVEILRRDMPRGVGYADVAGLKEAVKRKDISYVIQMDGDFSHDPSYIPVFLKEIKNSDVVIGSRFIKGGGDAERDLLRRTISIAANFFIRKYLRLTIKDCSSGYRCFRKEIVDSFDLDLLTSSGPAILEQMLYVFSLKGYSMKEIPINFRARLSGKTKLGFLKLLRVFFDIVFFKIRIAKKTRELR